MLSRLLDYASGPSAEPLAPGAAKSISFAR
jgi:hypothetical protein